MAVPAAAVRSSVVADDDESEEEEVKEEVIREVDDVLLNEFNLVRTWILLKKHSL